MILNLLMNNPFFKNKGPYKPKFFNKNADYPLIWFTAITKIVDIPAGQNATFTSSLFAGPQAKEELNKAAKEGKGAAQLDGRMIDAASARMAENIVNIHSLIQNK